MSERDRLVAVLVSRLEQSAAADSTELLSAGETLDAAGKLAVVIDPASDNQATYLLGLFHWLRYRFVPDAGQQALASALEYFAPVYRSAPESLPEGLRESCSCCSRGQAGWRRWTRRCGLAARRSRTPPRTTPNAARA